jgi:chaperonin GroEL
VLLAALQAPFLQIVRNQGQIHPPLALDVVRRQGCGYGLDVQTGAYVDMRERGIVDSLRVTQGALEFAVSSAKSLLTTGVVVMQRSGRGGQRVEP